MMAAVRRRGRQGLIVLWRRNWGLILEPVSWLHTPSRISHLGLNSKKNLGSTRIIIKIVLTIQAETFQSSIPVILNFTHQKFDC
jgi:hypothetical protein